jgi:hypothetical protein
MDRDGFPSLGAKDRRWGFCTFDATAKDIAKPPNMLQRNNFPDYRRIVESSLWVLEGLFWIW